jgi:osmotically-inducible protein OsmY
VLNTDRMSVDECVAQVDSALAQSRLRETPDSVRLAESLGLEWSIRAALRRDPRTASSAISVQCHDGIATLSGMIDNEEEVEAAHEATLAVSGVRSVRNLLRTAGFRAGRALKEA